jgi:outer membrane biosynthesis protein TonB
VFAKVLGKYSGKQSKMSIGLLHDILVSEDQKLEQSEALSIQVFLYLKNEFQFDIDKHHLCALLMGEHSQEPPKSERQAPAPQKQPVEPSQKSEPKEKTQKQEDKPLEPSTKIQEKVQNEPKKQAQPDPDREFDDFGEFEDEFQ